MVAARRRLWSGPAASQFAAETRRLASREAQGVIASARPIAMATRRPTCAQRSTLERVGRGLMAAPQPSTECGRRLDQTPPQRPRAWSRRGLQDHAQHVDRVARRWRRHELFAFPMMDTAVPICSGRPCSLRQPISEPPIFARSPKAGHDVTTNRTVACQAATYAGAPSRRTFSGA